MASETMDVPKTGFSFDLCRRNDMLTKKGLKSSPFLKTGTTSVGLVFQDGVILGADTRATEGPIVADKIVKRFITWHPTFTAVKLEMPLIQRLLQVNTKTFGEETS